MAYYSWYRNAFLPAEYNALIRELNDDIAAGIISESEAAQKVKDWKAFVADCEEYATKETAEEYPKMLERRDNNGNNT